MTRLHLAVALDGAGWHPAAWREASAAPDGLLDARYWADLATAAERGGIDFLTFEDAFTLQSAHPFTPDERVDQVRGRLDAALLAARVAPLTTHIGLVPTVTTTHTEPFHVSTRIASLDLISGGRAGWRVQLAKQRAEYDLFGRRTPPPEPTSLEPDELAASARDQLDDAADSVEVARRLWDSWEDDAVIRDAASGRYLDRDRVHHIDFVGEHFSVRGPSITPRPPQGQPLVTVLAHAPAVYELAARAADVVFVCPHHVDHIGPLIHDVRAAEGRVGRKGRPLLVYAELLVFLEDDASTAAAAKAHLDALDGGRLRSDARIEATTPNRLAGLLESWHEAGIDGFRLRPGRLPHDLAAVIDDVVPILRSRGSFPSGYEHGSLRERLGLELPANRYAQPRTAAAAR